MSQRAADGATRRVAVIGASSDHAKFGNKCVRAYLDVGGWTVFPVNPGGGPIEGLETYRNIADIPGDLDRIAIYLPPPVTDAMLEALAARGADEVYFNPGTANKAILERARQLGIHAIDACAIVAIGKTPAMYL